MGMDMEEGINAFKILTRKSADKRPLIRPRRRRGTILE